MPEYTDIFLHELAEQLDVDRDQLAAAIGLALAAAVAGVTLAGAEKVIVGGEVTLGGIISESEAAAIIADGEGESE